MTGPSAPRDLGALASGDLGALTRFLREHGLCDGPLSVRRIGDGHSNFTYAVSDGQRTAVVRRPPPPPAPPGAHDVLREARLMDALRDTAVPVPAVLATARAGEVFDVPCYVMSFAEGPVITAGTPAALARPRTRHEIGESLIDTLAALHAVDWRAVGLGDLGRPEGFNTRHLRRMERLIADDDGHVPAGFAPVRDWLAARVPPESGAAIVHSDFRIGNVVIAPDTPGRVAAVLDWELATVGDPLLDVGYFLASVPEPGEPLTPVQEFGTAMLEDGYPDRAGLAARYTRRTGRDLSALAWYTVMAQWKLAVLYEYSRRRAARGDGDPYYADPSLVASFLRAAHQAAELPVPAPGRAGRSPRAGGFPYATGGATVTAVFPDVLVAPGTPGLPERFFDRFVFNLHAADGPAAAAAPDPSVIFGLGVYPARDVIDGFAIVVTGGEQRNLRLSDELSAARVTATGGTLGPLSWDVAEPMRTWRAALGPNPAGLEFDLTWRARTPAWTGDVAVANADGTASSFAHLFQSGRYEGAVRVDGREVRVDGWYGQRDRSRGVRTMTGGQGLHLWVQAQFPDRSIGFLTAESRGHERLLLEGAVMHEDGRLDPVTDVRHDLSFDDGLDLRGGLLEVTTRHGAVYRIAADAAARGGYMSGGGYGGQHGRPMGRGHLEHDVYPLDGSVSPRTLDSALTDRLTAFTWDGTPGGGIFEFALTRSPSYTYQPTLP